MPAMNLILHGDGAFNGRDPANIIHVQSAFDVVYLDGGMESGKPSVAFGLELPDGTFVVAETSLALFVAAARAMQARSEG